MTFVAVEIGAFELEMRVQLSDFGKQAVHSHRRLVCEPGCDDLDWVGRDLTAVRPLHLFVWKLAPWPWHFEAFLVSILPGSLGALVAVSPRRLRHRLGRRRRVAECLVQRWVMM